MSEKKLIKPYKGSVENLISSKNRYIFMVGAGISIDPPANLLPAPQFIQYLLELCAPKEEIQNLLQTIEKTRGKVVVISSHSESAAQLKTFGGILALLRYELSWE